MTDAQGAVISGAKVTVTSKETDKSHEVKTGDDGFYPVSGLAPGIYTVAVEMEGFKKKVLEDITVSAEASVGVNIDLAAGAVSDAITITAGENTGALHTENPSIDGSISTREIQRLPQAGRDPYELVRLAPVSSAWALARAPEAQ